ncbi:hypothetical protein MCUN1_002226 [Malassezia cuniculi]|uniref:NADH:flavin oxidoreductase/NADH oxidase N-terminal domain-containing protein n=1 Tax=Malassezia cuniculi TaxID=948313 RepID=A0AAF0EVD9_9BASI|nr:hypothetical protein MCUN1_002226 [Malassezia cuniculi]
MSAIEALGAPLTLPSGAVMPNRFAKAPMEEVLSTFGGGPPNEKLYTLYQRWSKAGWGMILTGNINVDERYLGLPFDVVIPGPDMPKRRNRYLPAFRKFAESIKGDGADGKRPLAIAQINHTGRQSMRGSGRAPWTPNIAPSPVGVTTGKSKTLDAAMFGTPKEMTKEDIAEVIARFATGAAYCHEAGFDGVELHAAHGYLLSSFLNPQVNRRTDEYGGSAEKRFRIIREIIEETRKLVPKSFVIGIKLNSGDFVQGGQTEDDALQNVQWLADTRAVDFVEISGGSYENTSFMGSARSVRREGFFREFAQRCHSVLGDSGMRVIVTGGFVTRKGMGAAVASGDADAIGVGRASALDPELPIHFLDASIPDDKAEAPDWDVNIPTWLPNIPMVGSSWRILWYDAQIGRISSNQEPLEGLSMAWFMFYTSARMLIDLPWRLLDREW